MNERDTPIALKWCAIIGIFMLGFGIPWSSALFRLSFPLIFVSMFWAAVVALKWDGTMRDDVTKIAAEPISWLIVLFVMWVIASGLWTDASMAYYKFDMSQYLKLLMIPVLAIFIRNLLKDKGSLLFLAYLSGVLVLTLPTALDALGVFKHFNIDAVQYRNAAYRANSFSYFRNHIVHGFHVAALAAIVLLHAVLFAKNRLLALAVFIYALVDILFWTAGRMALLGLLVVLVFFMINLIARSKDYKMQTNWSKYEIFASVAIFLIILWLGLDSMRYRYVSVMNEVNLYAEESNSATSAGTRIHLWLLSSNIFFDSWLVGAGSGAFRHTLEITKDFTFQRGYSHTHNEYLTILSQFGLIGFSLLAGVVYLLVKNALKHQDPWIGKGFLCLLLVLLVNALSDSSLYNQWEGWAFVYCSAVMMGTRRA